MHLHQSKGYFEDISLCGKIDKPVNKTACFASTILDEAFLLVAVVTEPRHI